MDNIAEIIERLKELYEVDTNVELVEKLPGEVKKKTFDNWLYRHSIPSKHLKKFAEDKGASFGWLSTGEGGKYIADEPMFLKPEVLKALKAQVKNLSECEENPKLPAICSAFNKVDEGKQDDALAEILSVIKKYR